jgi:hypothetical protein
VTLVDFPYANAPRGGRDDLRRYAEQLGLEVPKLEQCVARHASGRGSA